VGCAVCWEGYGGGGARFQGKPLAKGTIGGGRSFEKFEVGPHQGFGFEFLRFG